MKKKFNKILIRLYFFMLILCAVSLSLKVATGNLDEALTTILNAVLIGLILWFYKTRQQTEDTPINDVDEEELERLIKEYEEKYEEE